MHVVIYRLWVFMWDDQTRNTQNGWREWFEFTTSYNLPTYNSTTSKSCLVQGKRKDGKKIVKICIENTKKLKSALNHNFGLRTYKTRHLDCR